ncbi:unnamed protein product [Ceutorhynchus assimilis]|uniref:Uncharacterized protein n=1 Tax=Ceutorhynchus assimilis TaxID=467358 RepID=A0A9N9QKZ7_9CUCU|nr:unnamed protein product [Ceutorhynchus assimilis]
MGFKSLSNASSLLLFSSFREKYFFRMFLQTVLIRFLTSLSALLKIGGVIATTLLQVLIQVSLHRQLFETGQSTQTAFSRQVSLHRQLFRTGQSTQTAFRDRSVYTDSFF